MTKLEQNFEMSRGESVTLTAAVKNNAGASVSLAGSTVSWKAVMGANSLTIAGSLVDVLATSDGVQVSLTPADTKDLPAGLYHHECRVVNGAHENVVFVGAMTLLGSTTKPT